jgi:hypothetical protein
MPHDINLLRAAAQATVCPECRRSLVDDGGVCPEAHFPGIRTAAEYRALLDSLPDRGADAKAKAHRLRVAGQLAALGPTPDPVPWVWLRDLIQAGDITQGEAARLLHVSPQVVRRWVAPPEASMARPCPWPAAELLRRILSEGR